MTLKVEGRYIDSIRSAGGQLAPLPERRNTLVYSALDLMAGLLSNERGVRGLLYWAVGSGLEAWDAAAPSIDRRTTRLTNEIYRKRLDPERDISYDAASHTLAIHTTFSEDEAEGVWREFGLFGGDASARPNSGLLFNYTVHPAIDKTQPLALERTLRLTLASDVMLDRAVALLVQLLWGRDRLGGIQYWALGAGSEEWDASPPAHDLARTSLTRELYRQRLDPARDIRYDADTRTLVVQTQLPFDQGVGVLREFGLFGGDATAARDSGYLLSHQVHPALDHTHPLRLNPEFRLTLGADAVTATPALVGMTLEAARQALENNHLRLGVVEEAERDSDPGLVIDQRPAAGDLVAEGAAVSVTVAVPARVAVPDLLGLSPKEARAILKRAGLALMAGDFPMAESDAPSGTIIRQTPAGGERVAPKTVVQIVIAMARTTLTPDLSGLTPQAAVIVLRKVGLVLQPPPFAVDERPGDHGKIVDQTPPPGQRTPVGGTVMITTAAPFTVEAPDLTGLMPDVAAERLRETAAPLLESLGRPPLPPGLVLGVQNRVESEAEEGSIVGQTPAPGERAPLYGAVDVQLASPAVVETPDLIGKRPQAAAEILAGVGLALGRRTEQVSVEKKGTIIAQEPRPGVHAPKGGAVDVVIAAPILVEVPDLIGSSLKYAQEVVVSRGLRLAKPETLPSEQPLDTVLQQKPKAGQRAALNSWVHVVIAAELEAQLMPNLLGLTMDEAVSQIEALGLVLAGVEERTSSEPQNTVLDQKPEPGQPLEPGQAVRLTIAVVPSAILMPNLVGLTLDDAVTQIEALGLVLAGVDERPSSEARGSVLGQKPAAGQPVQPGQAVRLVIAAPLPVTLGRLTAALGPEPDTIFVHATGMQSALHVLQATQEGPFDWIKGRARAVILASPPEIDMARVRVPPLQVRRVMIKNGRFVRATPGAFAKQMTVVFHLREGLRWDNGEPVTAEDSLFSFKLAAAAETPCSKFRTQRTASYEVVDDLTVVWTGLPGWQDAYPEYNFWPPLPAQRLAGMAPAEISKALREEPASYGPFALREWEPGAQLFLERHPEYFRADEGLPRADELLLRVGASSEETLELLAGGEIDMALTGSLRAGMLPSLRDLQNQGRLRLHVAENSRILYLMLNLADSQAPFSDQRIRQALAFAIDRKLLAERAFGGAAQAASSFIPSGHPMHNPDVDAPAFDPGRARALLAEAGMANGFQVTLTMPEAEQDLKILVEILAELLAGVGVGIDVRMVKANAFFARGRRSPLHGGLFQMALVPWQGGVEPPGRWFLCDERSGEANGWGAPNISGYCDSKFDMAVLAALSATESSAQRRFWAQAQNIFNGSVPAIPLCELPRIAATRPDLSGLSLDAGTVSELWNVESFT